MMRWEQLVEEVLQTHKHGLVSDDQSLANGAVLAADQSTPSGVSTAVAALKVDAQQVDAKPAAAEGEEGVLPKQRFGLGGEYGNAYLTYREAQCMLLFMRGKTVTKVAQCLKLSPRTIEFYLNNIKGKLNCRSKPELIEAIIETPFFNVLPQIEKELSYFGVELDDAAPA